MYIYEIHSVRLTRTSLFGSSEGESGTMSVPAQNATVQPSQTMTSNQPQVPSASSNNGNKVRVRSGGNENGSSGSSGSGPKVVMM